MELTLDEQIERDLKLAQEGEPEPKLEDEELNEDPEGEPDKQAVSEEVTEPEVKEEPKPEVKEEPKAKFDPEIAFQLRESKRKEAELNAKIAELSKPKEQPKPQAPDPTEDPVGYIAFKQAELEAKTKELDEWKRQQEDSRRQSETYSQATQEFTGYIARFTQTNPDFPKVAVHVEKEIAKHIRASNPNLSGNALTQAVDNQVLLMASKAVQAGIDPAAYIDHIGRTVYEYKEPEAKKPDPVGKPDLKVVDRNRKKSANGLGGMSGASAPSIADLEKMSIADMEQDDEASRMMGWR